MADLFVYGTLMDESLRTRLLGRRVRALPARLRGFQVRAVQDANYPALVPKPGETVSGWLLTGLDGGDLALLDAYEGDEYRRVQVRAEVAGRPRPAWVYLWCAGRRRLGRPL